MSPNDANVSPTDVTSRTNIVTLIDTTMTIVNVFPNALWMVSQGQPFTPPPTVTPNSNSNSNTYTIEFDAGRDDTSPIAEQFISLSGGAGNVWCTAPDVDSSPSELNFFFGMYLQLDANGGSGRETVYLGQGSSGWSNNWWIGGSCISSNGFLTATVAGQPVNLRISSDENNGFIFQPSS